MELSISSRKPSKNGELSLSNTAENKRQELSGREKIPKPGLQAFGSSESIETLCQRERYEKVDLIGHSMGGLVISAFYAGYVALPLSKGSYSVKYIDRSIRSKIGKIITLGTPYEGAPKLIQAVLTEEVLGNGRERKLAETEQSPFFPLAWDFDYVKMKRSGIDFVYTSKESM
ncbi:hypothetical protein GCWU000341_00226 [Oribacterium sp. oral taxon 078 str. F0262]|nr:hypothetical protein GCWU000341_00226 [Oribacterium sp. oral taxon 078 str. F0262]